MAMGNFCYAKSIECPYATAVGQCKDDIYEDFNLCEMEGDDMPPIEFSSEERRRLCSKQHAHWEAVFTCSHCGESVRQVLAECPLCHARMDEAF